jgi:hypothetical protein
LGTPEYKGVPKIQLGAPKPSKINVENQPHLNPMGFIKLRTIEQLLTIFKIGPSPMGFNFLNIPRPGTQKSFPLPTPPTSNLKIIII